MSVENEMKNILSPRGAKCHGDANDEMPRRIVLPLNPLKGTSYCIAKCLAHHSAPQSPEGDFILNNE